MLKYIIKRILMLIPVMLWVITIVFILKAITPGDPIDQILGADASVEQREAKREELGLNDPLIVQFGSYLWGIVTRGDLGTSYKTNQPVLDELLARFPVTIALALGWVPPICVVGLNAMSGITRITRSSMLEVIRQDYIRTARAKGQNERTIVVHHAPRSALIPIIANIGNQIGVQLGGALTIEAVFGLPGIGQYVVNAIGSRNFPAVQGGVILLAFTFTIVNLLVDIAYTIVDPRMKAEFSRSKPKKLVLQEAQGGAADG